MLFQLKCDQDCLHRSTLDIYLEVPYKIIDSPVENSWIPTYSNRLIKVIIYSNFFLLTRGGNWIQPPQTSLMGDSAQLSSFDFPHRVGEERTKGANHSVYHGRGSGDGCSKWEIFFASRATFYQFLLSTSQICHDLSSISFKLMYSNLFLKISSNENHRTKISWILP